MCNLVTWLVREQDILDDLCCLVVVAVLGKHLGWEVSLLQLCPCSEVGWVCSEKEVIPELWVCVLLTPRSCIFHCRDELFILLFGCEAGWWLWH